MRKRLLKLAWHSAATAALVLCAALCVLWGRSYRVCDAVHWRSATGFRGISSAGGKVVVQLNPGEAQRPESYGWSYWRGLPYTAPSYPVAYGHLAGAGRTFGSIEFAGVGWYTVRDGAGGRAATGVFPFWLLTAATGMVPVVWAAGLMRGGLRNRRRRGGGFCRSCGYDLRATPDRCPECGTVVPSAVHSSRFHQTEPPRSVVVSLPGRDVVLPLTPGTTTLLERVVNSR